MNGRDTGKPGICRHEGLGSRRMGRSGQDRVERAKARSLLEQAQSFAQVSFLDDKQRREQLYVVTSKLGGVLTVTTVSANVGELLDDLVKIGRGKRNRSM